MDNLSEIKRKLDSGNTILVAAATDNLINIIKSKIKGIPTDMINIPEMLLLQEYCCHKNPIICTTTLRALCIFMTTNNYQTQLLIDWLVVLNSQIKYKTGFIQEIFELIAYWLKNNENMNYKYIDTLIDILIQIMEENLNEWSVTLFHMKINTNYDNYEFIQNWLNVTKRLFIYVFLSQTPSNYRNSFIRLFVEIVHHTSNYDLLFEIYSWIQDDNLDDILCVYNFLEEFCDVIPDKLHEIKFNLCLCFIQTSMKLISYGYDPSHILQRLNKLLIICPCISDIVLFCISRTLTLCSSKFVLKIIDFCLKIIENYGCHKIISQTIVACILQWNRTKIIDDNMLLLFLSTINSNKTITKTCTQVHNLSPYLTSDSSLIMAYSLIKLCSKFDNKPFILKWLCEIDETSDLLNDSQFNLFLAGLYLSKIGDHSQQKMILKFLNKTILLPIIAYAVDLESNCYNIFYLMKVIPTAACIQENIPLIINFIKRFENSNEEALNILSIDMYYELWITETRCYRFLLYCLSRDKPGWQWNVVKSYTMKKIIHLNPNSDLVIVLKKMLKFYIKHSMYLPMKLTLESLVDLCINEYMKTDSLMKILDENIPNIYHPSIISSYCNLLTASINQTTTTEKRHESLRKLWSMVLHSNDNTVKCALKSLSNIDLDVMPLNVLPEKFQSFPKIITQLEDLEKMNLFNGPILGECWIKFLQNINKPLINEAQSMLSIWLKHELEKNVISRVQSDHEPKNLKHLSEHSIARGLMSFVVPKRKNMLDTDENIKVTCLAIINDADKPMYPFDWSFLEKYINEGPQNKLWKESVILIAKQSTKSTSAFRLLYKCYEHHSNFDNNQIKLLFATLSKVSNIIYHNLQTQFMTNVVNELLNSIINETFSDSNKDVDLLCYILFECKHILQNPETHMENINFIGDILGNIWCLIHLENKKILYAFLDCCLVMPVEMLKNLTPYPVQESMLIKFIILCCAQHFILNNASSCGFIECIQACNQFNKENEFLYDLIIEVFKLDIFIPYHHEFIDNFMVYLAGFTKKSDSFTNVCINNYLK